MTSLLMSEKIVDKASTKSNSKYLPSDIAIRVFIAIEVGIFSVFFITFALTQQLNGDMFEQGRANLSTWIGLLGTLTLMASSYFVALAVAAAKKNSNHLAEQSLFYAMLTASSFLALKLSEYDTLLELGYNLSSNSFFTLYFFITGFHFLHVLFGLLVLAYMGGELRKSRYLSVNLSHFKSVALYWHMLTLCLLVAFFTVYIIR